MIPPVIKLFHDIEYETHDTECITDRNKILTSFEFEAYTVDQFRLRLGFKLMILLHVFVHQFENFLSPNIEDMMANLCISDTNQTT